MRSYVLRDLVRNPRRSLASVTGIALAVGLFSGVSFFVDSSSSQMTARAVAPLTLDMQAGLINPLGTGKTAAVIANAPALSLSQIQAAARGLHGVRVAEQFASIVLPTGSVRGPAGAVTGPVTLMGFDPSYLQAFPLVRTTAGAYRTATGMLSQPATDLIGGTPGSSVTVSLPGRVSPLTLPVSGVADFASATPLFLSRSASTQGDFVASPYVVVVDTATFRVISSCRQCAPTPAAQRRC
jgi:hypothetical protein